MLLVVFVGAVVVESVMLLPRKQLLQNLTFAPGGCHPTAFDGLDQLGDALLDHRIFLILKRHEHARAVTYNNKSHQVLAEPLILEVELLVLPVSAERVLARATGSLLDVPASCSAVFFLISCS